MMYCKSDTTAFQNRSETFRHFNHASPAQKIKPVTLILALLTSVFAGNAEALSLNVSPSLLNGIPGSSVNFAGSIGNDSFYDLNTASDLFLNFSQYDPGILNPTDLLSLSSIPLNVGSTSSVFDLFNVGLAPSALPGIYDIQVSIQDVYGNDFTDFSQVYDFQIRVIPEPATYWLIFGGAALLSRKFRQKPALPLPL